MDPQTLLGIFSLFTALGFWVSVPYTPINPQNPIPARLLGSLQVTATSYGAASLLCSLFSTDHRSDDFFELPVALAGSTIETIPYEAASNTDGSLRYPTATVTAVIPPDPRSDHETSGPRRGDAYIGSNETPEWIIHTAFVLVTEEFWRSPNMWTVLAAILVPVWLFSKSLPNSPQQMQPKASSRASSHGTQSTAVSSNAVPGAEGGSEQQTASKAVSVRVDQLAANFQTIDQRVNYLLETVTGLQQNPPGISGTLPGELGNLKGRFKTLLPEFRSLQDDVKNLAAATSVLQRHSGVTSPKIKTISDDVRNPRRELAVSQLCQSHEKSNALYEQVRGLDVPTGDEERDTYSKSANMSAHVPDLSKKVADLQKSVTSKDEERNLSIAAVLERVKTLEDAQPPPSSSEEVSALSTKLEAFQKSATTKDQQLDSNVAKILGRVTALEKDKALPSSVEPSKGKTEADVKALSRDVQELRQNSAGDAALDALKSQVKSVREGLSERDQSIAATNARIELVEQTINGLPDSGEKTGPGSTPDQLDESHVQLQRKMESTDARVSTLTSDIDNLKKSTVANETRLDDLSVQVNATFTVVDLRPWDEGDNKAAADLKALRGEMQEMQDYFALRAEHDGLADTVDNISKKQTELSELQAQNTRCAKKLHDQVKKLTESQADIKAQRKNLELLREEMSELPILSNDRVKTLRNEYEKYAESLKEQMDAALSESRIVNEKLKALDANFSKFKQSGMERTKEIDVTKQVTDLKGKVSACKTSLDKVHGTVSKLESTKVTDREHAVKVDDTLDKLTERIGKAETDFGKFQRNTNEKTKEFDDTAKHVTDFKGQLSAHKANLEKVEQTVSELESARSTSGDQATAFEGKLDKLKERISTAENDILSTQRSMADLQDVTTPEMKNRAEETRNLLDKLSMRLSTLQETLKTDNPLSPDAKETPKAQPIPEQKVDKSSRTENTETPDQSPAKPVIANVNGSAGGTPEATPAQGQNVAKTSSSTENTGTPDPSSSNPPITNPNDSATSTPGPEAKPKKKEFQLDPKNMSRWDDRYTGPNKLGGSPTPLAEKQNGSGRQEGKNKGGKQGGGKGNKESDSSKIPKKATGQQEPSSTKLHTPKSTELRGSSWASDAEEEERTKKK